MFVSFSCSNESIHMCEAFVRVALTRRDKCNLVYRIVNGCMITLPLIHFLAVCSAGFHKAVKQYVFMIESWLYASWFACVTVCTQNLYGNSADLTRVNNYWLMRKFKKCKNCFIGQILHHRKNINYNLI